MVKIFDVTKEPSKDGVWVLVNPVTGQIYGFQPAVNASGIVMTPSTKVVGVETSPDNFQRELDLGLFYKNEAFYRGWPKHRNPRFVAAFPGDKVTIFAPGSDPVEAEVRFYKDNRIIAQYPAVIEKTHEIVVPNLESGTYTVRVLTEEYGRLTFTLVVRCRTVPETSAFSVESEKAAMQDYSDVVSILHEIEDPASAAEALTEALTKHGTSLLSKAMSVQEIKKIQDRLEHMPSEKKKTLKEQMKRLLEVIKRVVGR